MLLTLAQQTDLVNRKLAISKQNGNLITFKYHRRVMYDYLWKKHPELLECRGHTYDTTTGELVLAAPTKTFNYLEDGHWSDVPLDTKVTAYKKYNGFMGTVSIHNGEYVLGTTGTANGTHDFGNMFRELFEKHKQVEPNVFNRSKVTWLYEVIHENDPHIVYEKPGLVYLGRRVNNSGLFIPEISDRDEDDLYYEDVTLGQMLEIIQHVKHEGFMVYDAQGNCCKLKSPYYVGKKKLMRANKDFVEKMYSNKLIANLGIPSEWYDMAGKIVEAVDKDTWLTYTDQQRRKIIEQME